MSISLCKYSSFHFQQNEGNKEDESHPKKKDRHMTSLSMDPSFEKKPLLHKRKEYKPSSLLKLSLDACFENLLEDKLIIVLLSSPFPLSVIQQYIRLSLHRKKSEFTREVNNRFYQKKEETSYNEGRISSELEQRVKLLKKQVSSMKRFLETEKFHEKK